MTFFIRPSLESDVPAIAAIYAHAVTNGLATFELEAPSAAEMAARWATIAGDGFPFLTAERDGAILGYAYAAEYRSRPAYRFTVEDSVYVSPLFQGRGVGRALLAQLIERCEALGFRSMVAVIGDTASAGSIRLHETLGFTHAGGLENVGYKHGRWLATVLMQRPLGQGAASPPSGLVPGTA